MIKKFFLFGVWGVLILAPFLVDRQVFRQNDLPAKLINEAFLKRAILEEGRWPQWNFYLEQGIPMAADPLADYLNPAMGITFLLLNQQSAVKMVFWGCAVMAGLCMYLLARQSGFSSGMATALGMTYEAGGFLAGVITAGHAEKALTYPLLPLFLLLLLRLRKQGRKWSGWVGLVWILMLFSGCVYSFWYAGLAVVVTGAEMVLRKMKNKWAIAEAGLWMLVFGAVKWWPALQIFPFIEKVREPFVGSQNLVSVVYHLFVPLSVIFKELGLWRFVPTGFGWWGKAGFIGPVWILGLAGAVVYRRKLKLVNSGWWWLLILVFLAVAMPAAVWNPYHWLINSSGLLQGMHVPTRIWAFLTIPVLIIAGRGLSVWDQKKTRILTGVLVLNTLGLISFWWYVQTHKSFPRQIPGAEILLLEVKTEKSPGIWQIAPEFHIPENRAAEAGWRVVNSTYGVHLRGSAGEGYWQGRDMSERLPEYLLTGRDYLLPFEIQVIGQEAEQEAVLYEVAGGQKLTSTGSAEIGADQITVKAWGKQDQVLTVFVSNFPGWRVRAEGTEITLIEGGYLRVKMLPGEHTYLFEFTSTRFIQGLIVSFSGLLVWLGMRRLYNRA